MRRFLLVLWTFATLISASARQLRVLAVGNSYSADAVEEHLWQIAAELGDTLIIGNAYQGGCDIDRHLKHLTQNLPAYEYRKIVEGNLTKQKECSLRDIICNEPWDIVTFQQASWFSGKSDTFANLPQLIDSVRALSSNKDSRLMWHRTWSYANGHTEPRFAYYGNDQRRMDDSIATVAASLPPSFGITQEIPSGVAITNARYYFDDSLNRDGTHLALPLGRYVAALTWAEALTGKSVVKVTYRPEGLSAEDAELARKAAHYAVSQRPSPEDRLFRSRVIEEEIRRVKALIEDPKLAWMFENCFPNTLDTTVFYTRQEDGTDDTFVITGDIHAMWLRDSGAQVWPYLRYATSDPELQAMIRGLILRQLKCIRLDPYANAFNYGADGGMWQSDFTDMIPEVHERKWEIDSLCYPIRLAYEYWKITGDDSIFGDLWLEAVEKILATFTDQQRKDDYGSYTFRRITDRAFDTLSNNGLGSPVKPVGLIASSFRPSDDATTLQFLVPSNFFAVSTLRKAAEILKVVNRDERISSQAYSLADEVETALQKYAVYDHPEFGKIYAYEVDGFGNRLLMDDANIPSLLSLPYLEAIDSQDPVYQNTRRFLWSDSNPYFFRGSCGEGIGGPHVGYNMAWPMSILSRALTSSDVDEIRSCINLLLATDAETGFIHESFNVDNPADFTRPWFAWQNSLFAELLLRLASNPN